MDLLIRVDNQRLRLPTNLGYAVEGSQKFVKFKFTFSDNWNGLKVFAQFGQSGKAYNAFLDSENCVYLPSEIVAGECTLMLYGSYNDVIATSNYLTLRIDDSLLVENADSTVISESLYNQLVTQVEGFSNRIDNVMTDPLFIAQVNQATSAKVEELVQSGAFADMVIGDNSIAEVKLDNSLKEKINKPIDVELSESSENAVQNKVIKKYIDNRIDYVTPEMFGAVGDGVTDDTEAFEKMFSSMSNKWELRTVSLLPNKQYSITKTINILSGTKILGNNSKIKSTANPMLKNDLEIWDCLFKDVYFEGTELNTFYSNTKAIRNSKFININVNKVDKVLMGKFVADNIIDCVFSADLIGELTIFDSNITNCLFNIKNLKSEGYAINLQDSGLTTFNCCFFNGLLEKGVPTFLRSYNSQNINIESCNFDYNDGNAILLDSSNANINNCTFRGNGRGSGQYIYSTNSSLTVSGCSFLMPHSNGVYNDKAFIINSNGDNKKVVLYNNNYYVPFLITQPFSNRGVEKIVVNEPCFMKNNVTPVISLNEDVIKDGLSLIKVKNGFWAKGSATKFITVFICGTYNSEEVIYSLSAGKYFCDTGCLNCKISLRTKEGTINLINGVNEVLSDINILSVAITFVASEYNIIVNPNIYIL